MASANSTALPREVGLKYRRLYSTMVASVTTLMEIETQLRKQPRNKRICNTLIDVYGMFMSNLESQMDELGVPKDWRD